MATPPVTDWDELRAALDQGYSLTNSQLSGAARLMVETLQAAEQKITELEARVERLESRG